MRIKSCTYYNMYMRDSKHVYCRNIMNTLHHYIGLFVTLISMFDLIIVIRAVIKSMLEYRNVILHGFFPL